MRSALAASLSLHLVLVVAAAFLVLNTAPMPPPRQTSIGWIDVVRPATAAPPPSGMPGEAGPGSQLGSVRLSRQSHAPEAPARSVAAGLASPAPMRATPAPSPAIDRPAMLRHTAANRPPVYPAAARRAAMQGTVVLEVRVAPDGRARSVAIARSSGFPLLDTAAREAVSGWKFQPALRAGIPVAGATRTSVRFSLVDAG